jgi:hypothetical protein
MADHPEVFISATTADLGSYRREIKDALLTLRIFPIEQSNFELAYGPLTEMLRGLIERCDAVIHVAGFNYGAEPPQSPLGEGRRSYTQIEYHVARELGKPVYLFLAAENYEPDNRTTESEEEKELQLAHRHTIENCGHIYYRFSTHKEIGKRVRELRFPERIATAPRRVVNLPYESLGALFKGRDAVLTELERRFQAGEEKTVGLSTVQAIYGLGGVGKTRLAIEYAWRHAGGYAAMLFISGRSPADLLTDLAALCDPQVLNLPEQARPEQAVRLAAVFRWLSSHPGWLLIFDSIDTPEAAAEVEKTLPQLQGGQVIVTSRISDWSFSIQTLELDVLSEKDAAAFFLERTESKRMKISGDANEAVSLARELAPCSASSAAVASINQDSVRSGSCSIRRSARMPCKVAIEPAAWSGVITGCMHTDLSRSSHSSIGCSGCTGRRSSSSRPCLQRSKIGPSNTTKNSSQRSPFQGPYS